MINSLINKYEENIIECDRVIQAYQHTEEMRSIHKGIKQCSKEMLQDLKQLKENYEDKIFNGFEVLDLMLVEDDEMVINKGYIRKEIIGD